MSSNKAAENTSEPTLQHIHQQHKNPCRLPEYAQGVRRANISTAGVADVDAFGFGNQESSRNRAEQIRPQRRQDVSEYRHGASVGQASSLSQIKKKYAFEDRRDACPT